MCAVCLQQVAELKTSNKALMEQAQGLQLTVENLEQRLQNADPDTTASHSNSHDSQSETEKLKVGGAMSLYRNHHRLHYMSSVDCINKSIFTVTPAVTPAIQKKKQTRKVRKKPRKE